MSSLSLVIAANEARFLKRDPSPLVQLVVMPLLLMAFIKPAFAPALAQEGLDLNGSEQAVPGMAVMFGFFVVPYIGLSFFREHGWRTWDRLRSSRASYPDILVGKMLTPLVMSLMQLAIVFALGAVVFDLHVRGSVLGLAIVTVALSLCLVSLSLAMVAVCRTIMQLTALANLAALGLAGLGGALTPISVLPGWARAVAPATPSYWAMRGHRSMIIDGAGLGAVVLPTAILLLFTAGFLAVAAFRFRFSEVKTSWA